MSLLSAHLEQISMSCQGIDSLPFPPPKIFTNALLSSHDITSLIRDTEAHERALFSVPPPHLTATSQNPDPPKPSSRRQTVFNVAAGEVTTGPPPNSARSGPARRNTAVAAVLGGDLHAQIVRPGGHGAPVDGRGDVDIEVLLHGAEKLCTVYPLPGALERIPSQRQKYAQQSGTLDYYEAKVAEQQEALERINMERWVDDEDDDIKERAGDPADILTDADLKREEDEVRELDKKKRELQQRLRAIEADLGGLLNM
ncbi:DASH complex subunit Spc34 [Lasiosphaeria miniovina]|uniref:DASH complex subunit SPC34 n=1 Tax=Lasiosphaeria miniovina TaxID=1954250 RepID=A0AA40DTQ6_9PEZI|nr:DASH complex subunit Spc34 [Lasiosphaeria miniovina]KAK0713002.1 DASH complex subunit Spc34 [Lasiosphaeria miniovina]